jgi:hypothetical protein
MSQTQDVSVESAPESSQAEGTEVHSEASSGSENSQAMTQTQAEAAIAKLGADDYGKLMTIKDENGNVVEMTVKQFVNRTYSAENKAKRAELSAKKQVDETLNKLVAFAKAQPGQFLKHIGVDPEEFSEGTLKQKLSMLEASPEARRLAEVEQELAQYKSKDEQAKKRQEQEAMTQSQIKAQEAVDTEMTEAFKASDLPRDPYFIQLASAVMINSIEKNQAEIQEFGHAESSVLSAKEALDIVKSRFSSSVRNYFSTRDANQIREMLGKEIIDKVRQDDIQRVTNQLPNSPKSQGTPPKAKKEPKVFVKDEDYRQWVESLKR